MIFRNVIFLLLFLTKSVLSGTFSNSRPFNCKTNATRWENDFICLSSSYDCRVECPNELFCCAPNKCCEYYTYYETSTLSTDYYLHSLRDNYYTTDNYEAAGHSNIGLDGILAILGFCAIWFTSLAVMCYCAIKVKNSSVGSPTDNSNYGNNQAIPQVPPPQYYDAPRQFGNGYNGNDQSIPQVPPPMYYNAPGQSPGQNINHNSPQYINNVL